MHSLLLDADIGSGTFQDFCDNMGYSNDSIAAFKTYTTCGEYAVQLRKVFTREQMAQMMDDLVSAGKRSALDELMNEELNKAEP